MVGTLKGIEQVAVEDFVNDAGARMFMGGASEVAVTSCFLSPGRKFSTLG